MRPLFSYSNFLFYAAGASQEITPAGTVQVLTPSAQATPQSSELLETSQPDEMNNAVILSEAAENEGTTNVPAEDAGSLDKFLPPPPKEKCPEELQVSSFFLGSYIRVSEDCAGFGILINPPHCSFFVSKVVNGLCFCTAVAMSGLRNCLG